MTLSVLHSYVSTVPDDANPDTVSPSDWNDEHNLVVGAASLLGAAAAGPVVELTAAQARTILNVEDGATNDQTAAEILTALLTVDGAGSGLDADLLDGQSSAFYATASSVSDHLADTSDAHDASAISFVATGGIAATDVQAALAELDAEKQPLDADLTSWAGVTRAAGFDTFVATPSSANLATLVTDETGSGALVFGTGPTLASPVITTSPTAAGSTWTDLGTVTTADINGGTVDGTIIGGASAAAGSFTSVTSPSIIGGAGTTSTLTLKTTTGVGTTNADMIFQVGNNGATEAMRILNSAFIGMGIAAPTLRLVVGAATSTLMSALTAAGSTEGVAISKPQTLCLGAENTSTSGATAGAFSALYSNDGAAMAVGDRLGGFLLGGSSSSSALRNAVLIAGWAEENWVDGSNYGAYLSFETTAVGGTARTEKLRLTGVGNLKLGGSANRGTTEGTNQFVLFDGTAPVGTLTNGVSLYSASGELRSMDAAGNSTLLSPHDRETNEWVYDSVNTVTGHRLRVDMERLVRAVNKHFGWDFVHG